MLRPSHGGYTREADSGSGEAGGSATEKGLGQRSCIRTDSDSSERVSETTARDTEAAGSYPATVP
jgi:hypothetical protein